MKKRKNILHIVGDSFNNLYYGPAITSNRKKQKEVKVPSVIPKKTITVPSGRISQPRPQDTGYGISALRKESNMVKPEFNFESIGTLRKLYKHNEDVGSVLMDLVQLTNTGHKIKFDQSVKPDMVDKMRKHLRERSKDWGSGTAGVHGIINKMIAQIWISGALSAEMVPARGLTHIDNVVLVDAETIRFKLRKKDGRYEAYQLLKYFTGFSKQYIKLNPNTYKYYGLISDTDTPYGVPPFMTALKGIGTQDMMKKNIDHILNQMGLLGYLEVNVEKPDQGGDESVPIYTKRLNKLLDETKENVQQGFLDGVVVGFKEDHEFNFQATTKNLNGVPDLFNQNENQIANGLKTSGTFLGLSGSGTEQMLSIVFTKMLSQLKNVQLLLSAFLEELYRLELVMAGYDFKSLSVNWNPSTITDDLKIQQATEIKQRIAHNLWIDGIIGQEAYADRMGEEKADRVVEPPPPAGYDTDSVKKEKKEGDKDKSDRKGRDKKKTQPKRKDTDTKKR